MLFQDIPEEFTVEVLIAGNNIRTADQQAEKFHPDSVVIGNTDHYQQLKENLKDTPVKVYAGEEAIEQVVTAPTVDVVIAAIVGYSGLRPTIAAIKAGRKLHWQIRKHLLLQVKLSENL